MRTDKPSPLSPRPIEARRRRGEEGGIKIKASERCRSTTHLVQREDDEKMMTRVCVSQQQQQHLLVSAAVVVIALKERVLKRGAERTRGRSLGRAHTSLPRCSLSHATLPYPLSHSLRCMESRRRGIDARSRRAALKFRERMCAYRVRLSLVRNHITRRRGLE